MRSTPLEEQWNAKFQSTVPRVLTTNLLYILVVSIQNKQVTSNQKESQISSFSLQESLELTILFKPYQRSTVIKNNSR